MLVADPSQLKVASRSRIVVIGAGAVGLYAASLLSARGHDVVVVEAGDSNLGSFPVDSYSSVGRTHEGVRTGRGRCIGGTTNLWGGQLAEFQPIDFSGRDWLPQSTWPVTYSEIAPYFNLTYQNLGLPPQTFDDKEVWRGIDGSRPVLGSKFEVFLTRWLRVPNFAALFAAQIHNSEELTLLSGHTAVGFRGSGGRIESVCVVNNQGQADWIDGEVFIVAAGTVENSRLLLHAAEDPEWRCPWRQNQNIGRFFQDHLGGRIGIFRPADKRAFFDMFSTILSHGSKFQPKIRICNEGQALQRILNIQAMFAFDGKASEHVVYLKQFLRAALFRRELSGLSGLLRHGFGVLPYLLPLMWRYLRDHRVFIPGSTNIFLTVQAEQVSCRNSRITIDRTRTDSHGLPSAILDWQLGEHELASIRAFACQIQETLHSKGVGELEIDEDLLASNPSFLSKLGDTYHQAGGTVMGWSEDDGVVDRDLRVFGTENLYIGGASTFRTSSNANTTFTALCFATRLADHIARSGVASLNATAALARE